ncbi:hypothetical protein JQC92_19915 [Shewanella sp. 202IG2-18]|uniref:hypothetical protein n=1 Tax=Parashewanella hymeniacidonis TaxID=2807618 RepID=UPI001961C7DD|nr:hypothetical protein [Parashewanella hymeniacidonis]MBM7074265.1 hypothetical protein [Parashewanella hymeniacidonis]
MLNQVKAALDIWEYFKGKLNKTPSKSNSADRFLQSFEAHGVARSQIPRFFGHGLTLYQVENDDELLKVLNHQLLEAAAKLFRIRLEWLEGASSEIYDVTHFYKQPAAFGDYIDKITASGNRLTGWLINTKILTHDYDSLILLEEQIGAVGEKPIYRYHFCELWIFNYWKCRVDLAACVAQGWKKNCYIHGETISKDQFFKLSSLKYFPCSPNGESLLSKSKRWDADMLAEVPEKLIANLFDGEWGKQSALARWFQYDKKGLMDTGYVR